jgi:predicted nucleotidyltransferase
MVSAAPTLRQVANAIDEAGLEAIMIGNAGAALLGARVTTEDFDFMIRESPANLRKLRKIADRLGAVLFQPYYPSSRMFRLERDGGLQVDFLMRVDGVRSFESLRSRSDRLNFKDGWSVVVASLPDIIKSKRAVGRPKDLAVLPELEATQREREERGL